MDDEDLAKLTATNKLQEDRGNNRLMARRRCRIDFEHGNLSEGNVSSSLIMNSDLSRFNGNDSNEIKEEEEEDTDIQGSQILFLIRHSINKTKSLIITRL